MSEPSATQSKTAQELRAEFLDFFAERGHTVVPSAGVFPADDPTLLFTNAGMNQFKDVFLGTGTRDYSRAVDTQKCIRVSGKHNDLEEVGVDTYHHTFFEMLGNWSFGDYFKREAITWAWELLTEVWKLPKERLWVTVFEGDEKDGLPADEEAERLWTEETDIDRSHVLRFDREDNFWEMGDTGPCGPCTEIHIDRGGPETDPTDGANREIGVNAGNERFIELWNLVFIQFNRMDDGHLQSLPAKHVDTGMGFERILSVLQGKSSNYDTDLFTPIFAKLTELTGKPYGDDEQVSIAFRVIADHCRALSTAFADGALPENTGRGYVLRRLLRRASRYGRQVLGMEEPFLYQVIPTIAEVLGDVFPEIPERLAHIQLLVKSEEESFGKTLDRGLGLFEKLAEKTAAGGEKVIPGGEAYKLYETYGFPEDLVHLMARESGLSVDEGAWAEAKKKHEDASRSDTFKQLLSADEMVDLTPTASTYHAEGEEGVRLEASVVGFFPAHEGRPDRIVLTSSPFYPEGGGQVGDSGVIETLDGTFRFLVEDTRKAGEIVVHLGKASGVEPGHRVTVRAVVDAERRDATRANHTATHLLHKALREVLGDHVTQAGSYVGPDRLRFDLTHPQGIAPEELQRIEDIVNERIVENRVLETTLEELEEAKARGVMALFGEKYDDRVRVVAVGDWSQELCGGTHVRAAGDIGPFVIVSERAIQAGVRRIEALTRKGAFEFLREQRQIVAQSVTALKAQKPADIPEKIASLQKSLKEAKKAKSAVAGVDLATIVSKYIGELEEKDGIQVGVFDAPEVDGKSLKDVCDKIKGHAEDLVLAVFGRQGEKVPFFIAVQGAARDKGFAAGDLAKLASKHLGGGGGGSPEKAQGQGLKAEGVAAAVEELKGALGA